MFDIQDELKRMPDKPGIYIMKDHNGRIIYVGKAVNLKNRVRQYFQHSSVHSPKVRAMAEKISVFEYIVTDTEMEALILECNLIKQHKPRYNIKLIDDKNYPYIKVTLNERFPRLQFTRKADNDGARYFGPYSSASSVRTAIGLVKRLFPLKSCTRDLPRECGKDRPCLNYHIFQCLGPCRGEIAEKEYHRIMEDVCAFLAGRQEQVVKSLNEQMEKASAGEEYEKAANLRNKINALQLIGERQKVASAEKLDTDVIGYARGEFDTVIQVLLLRSGKLIEKRHFIFEETMDDTAAELISAFVTQYYGVSSDIPQNILIPAEIAEKDTLVRWLTEKSGRKVNLRTPKRGAKLEFVRMAGKNALFALQNHEVKLRKESNIIESLAEIGVYAGLDKAPLRIEAYDVSNIGASDMTSAMVVYRSGIPDKEGYKRFKIKTVDGQNDYAAIQETIHRRFRRLKKPAVGEGGSGFNEIPDLIFVDGGKGHVNAVKEVLNDLGLELPVLGLVKDDRHRTRAVVGQDLKEKTPPMNVLRLLTGIQDEAHRFAISYNRKLRQIRYKASELDKIAGIGPRRKSSLLRHFGSIAAIRDAGIRELAAAGGGMSIQAARSVYAHFHGNIDK